jgi:uncharacterized protein YecE (DUF72 family)
LSTYLETVVALSDAQNNVKAAARREAAQQAARQWSERLTPLEERLKRLLSQMPEEMIAQGLSLDHLRRLLAGKWRGNCHPGELGAALRRLGFVRRRNWSDADGGFRALWYLFEKSGRRTNLID